MSTANNMMYDRLRLAGLVMGLVLVGSQMLDSLMFLVPLGWPIHKVPLTAYLNLFGPFLII